MTRRVLMVDDEEDLVWSTARQVSRERPDLDFVGLTDPEQALAQVKASPPDVLVTDIRMPRMSGLELIVAARSVAPRLPVVVVTAYGSPEVRADVQRAQGVEYLDKPFTLQALLGAVDQAASGGSGFSGAISLPMLPDLIQIYAISRASGTLRITRGPEQGVIWFQAGDIVHATSGELRGEPAVYRLLTWNGGTFALDPSAVAPERSITASWQELLVEGCRLLDEGRRDDPGPPTSPSLAGESLWQSLAPHLEATAPQALVVTVDLGTERALVRQGAGPGHDWPAVVKELLDAVARVSGTGRGATFEGVLANDGLVVTWDREQGTAIVFAEPVAGQSGVSRFRSTAARWRETCGRYLRCE